MEVACNLAWTDAEMFSWTVAGQFRQYQPEIRPYDRQAYQFWRSLRKFSYGKDLLEDNFIGRLKDKQVHSLFWELYLAKVFYEKEIHLKKQKIGHSRNQPSLPDFYFENHMRKIWIEAAAVGDIRGINEFLTDTRTDFEKGILREDDPLKLRLTSVIEGKIKKYRSAIEKEPLIIAFNGYKAVCGQADSTRFPEMPFPSRIESVLFGTGNFYIEVKDGKRCLRLSSKNTIRKNDAVSINVGYFSGPEYSHISGMIYSNASLWHCNLALQPLGHDFLFIPNPYAKHKVDNIFAFCRESKWAFI
jgi:hypothetical protein